MSRCHHIVRWPNGASKQLLSSLVLVLLLVSGIEAIVKQQTSQQQQQQASSQSSLSQASSQRSDDSSASPISQYNNHQASGQASGPSSASSSSSSSAISGSSVASSVSSSPSASTNNVSPQSYGSSSAPQQQQQQQASAQQSNRNLVDYANNGPKSYMDSMAAAATNTDQSYQAAANTVNAALANSGIYGSAGNSGYASSYGSQQQQASGLGQQQGSGSASAQSNLSPLHYLYYPPKEASNVGQQQTSGKSSSSGQAVDMMSNAASNMYPSMASSSNSYASYMDQLGALASLGAPEAAASSQDASYLPQPGAGMDQSGLFGSQNQHQVGHNSHYGDLSGYASNMNPQQVVGNNNNNNQQQQPQQQQQQQHNSNGVSFNGPSSGNEFMNQQTNGQSMVVGQHQQGPHNQPQQAQSSQANNGPQQQQVPPVSAYQSAGPASMYNQLGDLSTSNFGNNGGLSSVASYMAPNGQQTNNQHQDLFSQFNAAQFNSAASQPNPSLVAPPQQAPNTNNMPNSFSSLFGSSSANHQGNQAGASSLFSGQHYLNSFLTPQQAAAFAAGQQSANGDAGQPMVSATNPSSAVASSNGSGKRFGISSFIMPMLALAGLSLLIPTMSNIGTAVGRKKRSIGEERASASTRQQQINYDSFNGSNQIAKETSIGEYMDRIERYYSLYKNAVENEKCLNRLICEFGDAVKDISGKSAVMTVIERLVPNWMTGKVHLFKEAALDSRDGKEKCKQYTCDHATNSRHH